ncbi:Alpha/Beta hydrolase protein [Ilyonectria sp. MPI-CAGE-AT-0026]|nr:Alpha/Beta hydrolase protein [Ilyonectria sp. MPI-CAGE-AT-0026]
MTFAYLSGRCIQINHLTESLNSSKIKTNIVSQPTEVSFVSRSYKLAAHFYPPVSGSPDRAGAAIIICHPWTPIKEQSPANYARVLSQAGFSCLAYDAAYQGESEGLPRALEDPGQRAEDIKAAVTYLVSRKDVDSDKIGVVGICASGGYAPYAAQTDLGIEAVATSAAVCVGTMARRGLDKDSSNMDNLQAQLQLPAKDRNSDVGGEEVEIIHMLPDTFDAAHVPDEMPELFQDLASYYRTSRANHPRATNTCLPRSWDLMANPKEQSGAYFGECTLARPLTSVPPYNARLVEEGKVNGDTSIDGIVIIVAVTTRSDGNAGIQERIALSIMCQQLGGNERAVIQER